MLPISGQSRALPYVLASIDVVSVEAVSDTTASMARQGWAGHQGGHQ
jgi:hypothetical protein